MSAIVRPAASLSRLASFLAHWATPRHPCNRLIDRDLARALEDMPEYLRSDIGLDGGARLKPERDTQWPMRI
ncbi:hypothetical protein FNJ84_06450 [Paracoccus sp. M683]|uniref:hypothetical protein n=1 Tax=Paracoccus sp. M683 TaxID=2594268 RepID=UPI00117FB749|nr:hypothetical protein [Paracoccus sp. M683]TRW98412.1 hypothetical protein FNJ84_06450 [Paracoccus sp. M683]